MNKKLTIPAVALAAGLALAGCSKFTEPYNDAQIQSKDDSAAEVYSFPDGFSNVSTKCDKHGNRMYVIYHANAAYGSIHVVPQDPSCGGKK